MSIVGPFIIRAVVWRFVKLREAFVGSMILRSGCLNFST